MKSNSFPSKKTVNKLTLFLFVLMVVFTISCKKDEEEPKPQVTQNVERTKVIEDYKNNFLPSAVSLKELNWTGDTAICKAGTVSELSHQRISQRINYFRRATGLSDNITTDPELNKKCQEGALMCFANNALDHFPPPTWKCYTNDGAEALGHSNLAYGSGLKDGYHSSESVVGLIEDTDVPSLGHRRWLLYSELGKIGHGSTKYSAVFWVVDTKDGKTSGFPEFTSWPPKGYVMAPLVYDQWSFSIPGWEADFSNAKVEMFDKDGNTINLRIIPETVRLDDGYSGDNTIGWVPTNIIKNAAQDVTYKVKVSNVANSLKTSYEYDVIIVQP